MKHHPDPAPRAAALHALVCPVSDWLRALEPQLARAPYPERAAYARHRARVLEEAARTLRPGGPGPALTTAVEPGLWDGELQPLVHLWFDPRLDWSAAVSALFALCHNERLDYGFLLGKTAPADGGDTLDVYTLTDPASPWTAGRFYDYARFVSGLRPRPPLTAWHDRRGVHVVDVHHRPRLERLIRDTAAGFLKSQGLQHPVQVEHRRCIGQLGVRDNRVRRPQPAPPPRRPMGSGASLPH